MYIVQDYSVLF